MSCGLNLNVQTSWHSFFFFFWPYTKKDGKRKIKVQSVKEADTEIRLLVKTKYRVNVIALQVNPWRLAARGA